MIRKTKYVDVQSQLQAFLAAAFGEVKVEIGDNIHYRGTNVVVTSPAFAGLLPEQRYYHIVRAIPPDFYEMYLRGGVVWFELAPGESAQQYMRMPRSEDVVAEEDRILANLSRIDFFDKLQRRLAAEPPATGLGGFRAARALLAEARMSEKQIENACLLFIHLGAYDDADILSHVMQPMAGEVDDA